MSVNCFWLEPIRRARLTLRCHHDGPCPALPGQYSYHNAHAPLFDVDEPRIDRGAGDFIYQHQGPHRPDDVADEWQDKWPAACTCGFLFTESDRQVFSDHLYRRTDTGEVRTLREWSQVPGAMWDAEWMSDLACYRGPDGHSVHVVCPDGEPWCIDGPASNCTMPGDTQHKCWVRHGEPPNITVDKSGVTCSAGAGSIQTNGTYHGFLKNGAFT